MSIQPGVPDLLPVEASTRLLECMRASHKLRLYREGGAFQTNQNWDGYAIGIGCPKCSFVLHAPLEQLDVEALAADALDQLFRIE